MKFVKTSTDRDHLDEMLVEVLNSKLLCPESAINIVSDEENTGEPLGEDNIYAEYVNSLKNLAHSVVIEFGVKKEADRTYKNEEIEDYIKELTDKL